MINVIAREGIRVPLEQHSRQYITEETPVAVDEQSAYYLRRLRDGDLLLAPASTGPDTPVVPDAPEEKNIRPAPEKQKKEPQ
ncbi:hypothetical protein ODW83_003155 [Salmonella enterica]|nr:hypothetical protein [Salmonella enterica]EKC7206353.1 hypothetical protein [Salmonella enterica]EKC7506746.1 hypothetical protein [Salmonella enterica]